MHLVNANKSLESIEGSNAPHTDEQIPNQMCIGGCDLAKI